jgi:putative tributyrin esterase
MIEMPYPWPTNPWATRFRTVRSSAGDLTGDGLTFLTVQSESLGGRGDLLVSSTVADDDLVDVVVLLHGVYGSFWSWAFSGGAHHAHVELVGAENIRPMVLVMPSDGLVGEGTLFADQPRGNFASWVDDAVDAALESLGVGLGTISYLGTSMGAFAAAHLSARRGDAVATVMHSPICHLDDLAKFTVGDIGDDIGLSADERDVAQVLRRAPVGRVMIDCGIDDFLLPSVRALHIDLEADGFEHRYDEIPGTHSWDLWRSRIFDSLRFVDTALSDVDRASELPKVAR